ncbi:WYL domain-containing protein [Niabella aquatica]
MNELSNNLKIKGEEIEVIDGEYNRRIWKLVSSKGGRELTTYDINTFYLLKTFTPSSILEHRKDFFEKLERQFYSTNSFSKFESSVDAYTLGLRNTNFYEAQYTKHQHEIIEQCIWAIQNKKKIVIKCLVSPFDLDINKVNTGDTFFPLLLLHHRGLLHLVAYNYTKRCIVIIGFQALEEITLTNQNFNSDRYYREVETFNINHFGITQNINQKIYNIELEFDRGTGHYISCFFWHVTQKISEQPNGKFRMTLRCGINGELIGWIFNG